MRSEEQEIRELLTGLVAIWDKKGSGRSGSPSHGHNIPGIWDSDNGVLAGKPCAECALYDKARALARAPDAGEAEVFPIVRVVVKDDKIVSATQYAPGLPDGEHDVYPVRITRPEGAGEAEAEVKALRSALNAMLTQFGMDEDEWNCHTFNQARKALGEKPSAPEREPSPTAGMTLAERIAHVGGRENAQTYIEFGSVMAVDALIKQVLRDLPTAPNGLREALEEIAGTTNRTATDKQFAQHLQRIASRALAASPTPSDNRQQYAKEGESGKVEPVAYVNGDELANMLGDRVGTIQGKRSSLRSTELYTLEQVSAIELAAVLRGRETGRKWASLAAPSPAPATVEPEPTRDAWELESDFEHRLNAWHRSHPPATPAVAVQAEPVVNGQPEVGEIRSGVGCSEPTNTGGVQAAARQSAGRFSCYLQRDYGKAPCDRDCGMLRCMYPSKPAAPAKAEDAVSDLPPLPELPYFLESSTFDMQRDAIRAYAKNYARSAILLGGWESFLETWPRWGSMRAGECFLRPMSAPPISGNGSGFWPTPVASDTGQRKKKYAQGGTALSLAVRLYPTPTAGNHKSGGYLGEWGGSRARERMREMVPAEELFGPLNPEWVEWLMNWPIGWTSLEPLDHDNFKYWQKSSAAYRQSDGMREMWFHRDPSTSPQGPESDEQRPGQSGGVVPEVPQGRSHDGRDIGEGEGGACNMQGLLANVPACADAPRIDLRIGMPERVGTDQCTQEVVSRMKNNVPHRVDRLKALGNGQVSRVAATAWRVLK